MKRKCGNCIYWHGYGDLTGECRRHAPRPVCAREAPDRVWYAVTKTSFWCGDFREGEGDMADEILSKSVDDLDLPTRAYMACKNENMVTIRDVLKFSEDEFMRLPNFGRKSLADLKAALARFDLQLSLRPHDG